MCQRLLRGPFFEENQEAIYEGLAKALIKGNAYVYKELSDRAYGKLEHARHGRSWRPTGDDLDRRQAASGCES